MPFHYRDRKRKAGAGPSDGSGQGYGAGMVVGSTGFPRETQSLFGDADLRPFERPKSQYGDALLCQAHPPSGRFFGGLFGTDRDFSTTGKKRNRGRSRTQRAG